MLCPPSTLSLSSNTLHSLAESGILYHPYIVEFHFPLLLAVFLHGNQKFS